MEHKHQRTDSDNYVKILYPESAWPRLCCQKAKLQELGVIEDDLGTKRRPGSTAAAAVSVIDTDDEIIKEFDYQIIMAYGSNDNVRKYSVEFDQCPLAHWKDPQDRSKDTMRVVNNAGVVLNLDYVSKVDASMGGAT